MILHFRWNFIASLNLTFIFHSVADSFSGGCYCESSVAHFGQSCKISGNCCKDLKILLSVRKYFFSRESSVSEFATAEQQEMFFFLFPDGWKIQRHLTPTWLTPHSMDSTFFLFDSKDFKFNWSNKSTGKQNNSAKMLKVIPWLVSFAAVGIFSCWPSQDKSTCGIGWSSQKIGECHQNCVLDKLAYFLSFALLNFCLVAKSFLRFFQLAGKEDHSI